MDMEEMEREYGIRHADVRRGLDGAMLVLEGSGEYAEDYQIRMLEENAVRGLLPVRGHGEDGASVYEYEVSGKISMKTKYREAKMSGKEMLQFISDLLGVIQEVNSHLLCPDRLLLDPAYIFWEDGVYSFCYWPAGGRNIWEAFHSLTESFVQWTDYRDDESVRTSFLLHRETMRENYSLHKITKKLEEMQQPSAPEQEEALPYDTAEHDWIARQEAGSSIMRETENMWHPVRDFLRRHRKPGWRDWDGIYIDEEEL